MHQDTDSVLRGGKRILFVTFNTRSIQHGVTKLNFGWYKIISSTLLMLGLLDKIDSLFDQYSGSGYPKGSLIVSPHSLDITPD